MALTRKQREIVERAKCDPEFNLRLLKELLREAVRNDPDLLERVAEKVDRK